MGQPVRVGSHNASFGLVRVCCEVYASLPVLFLEHARVKGDKASYVLHCIFARLHIVGSFVSC